VWVIDPTLATLLCGAFGLGVLSVLVTVMASDRSLKRSCSWLKGSALVQHNTRCPRPSVFECPSKFVGGGLGVDQVTVFESRNCDYFVRVRACALRGSRSLRRAPEGIGV